MSVEKIFAEMPVRFNAEKAADLNATVQFSLSGEGGGEWYVAIANGNCEVQQGNAEHPTATIKMLATDYADLTSGKLNPVNAFMMGKVKVEGDLNTVMKFQTLFT